MLTWMANSASYWFRATFNLVIDGYENTTGGGKCVFTATSGGKYVFTATSGGKYAFTVTSCSKYAFTTTSGSKYAFTATSSVFLPVYDEVEVRV